MSAGRTLLKFVLGTLAFVIGLPALAILLSILMSKSGSGIPMDPWTPKEGERIGAFIFSLMAGGAGGALLWLSVRMKRPNVVSMGVSRIWAVGVLLVVAGGMFLLRNLWLLVF